MFEDEKSVNMLIKYRKLYERLNSVIFAHKLIGDLILNDIYVWFGDSVCNGKPGYAMYVDDFKWELSEKPKEWIRVVLSSFHITVFDALKISDFLKDKVEYEYKENRGVITFIIYPLKLDDNELDLIAELTDLYLTLKK